jgi:hypothetical protein
VALGVKSQGFSAACEIGLRLGPRYVGILGGKRRDGGELVYRAVIT